MFDNLFSPLGKEYCAYFLYLSIFGYIMMFLVAIITIGLLIKSKGKSFDMVVSSIPMFLAYFIFYFQNRLLYSMCSGQMK